MPRLTGLSSHPDYYAARAAEEQKLADACRDSKARAVHLEMAERYAILARVCEAAPERPMGEPLTAS